MFILSFHPPPNTLASTDSNPNLIVDHACEILKINYIICWVKAIQKTINVYISCWLNHWIKRWFIFLQTIEKILLFSPAPTLFLMMNHDHGIKVILLFIRLVRLEIFFFNLFFIIFEGRTIILSWLLSYSHFRTCIFNIFVCHDYFNISLWNRLINDDTLNRDHW